VILLTPEEDPIKDAALLSTLYPKLNVLIRHGDISSKETFRRSAVHNAEKVCAATKKLRIVTIRVWRGATRKLSLNDGQIPTFAAYVYM
jgi:hypothetical protein